MRALTIRQPWASLIAEGVKTVETRSWSTKYRGPLAIHAAKAPPYADGDDGFSRWGALGRGGARFEWQSPVRRGIGNDGWIYRLGGVGPYQLPLGAVVATAELVDVVSTDRFDQGSCPEDGYVYWTSTAGEVLAFSVSVQERDFGNYAPGRFAWVLDNVKPLAEPIPTTGRQGLWTWRES